MRNLSLFFFLIVSSLFHQSIAQTQLGPELTGLSNLSAFGQAVAIDSVGHRVAIGAPQKNYGQYRGQVRVFDLIDSAWVQVGQDLDGASNNEFFGSDVAMSADGNTIIVRIAQLNSIGAGFVQVYQLEDTAWTQRGSNLNDPMGYFGHQVDINSNGSRIIIGSNNNYAQVFEWNDSLSDWEPLGATLLGSSACSPPEYFGRAVAIDGVGNRVIIGASNHDIGCSQTSNAGRAAVFEWNGSDWVQLGQSLFGANGYGFGGSVEISGNGNRIACGAANVFGKGRVFTYEYSVGTGTWEQYGDTIQGVTGDQLGRDVKLSYDGCYIACGAAETDQQLGRVKHYRLGSFAWTIDGADLLGAAPSNNGAGDRGTVGMNADGSIVIFGSPRVQSGICRVYQYPREADTTIITTSCGPYSLNGVEYDVSGFYSQSIASANSCDSTIQLELTILTLDSAIVREVDTLTAVQDSASYQWYNCDTGTDIPGETGQSFTATGSGNYAVKISNGTCEVSSECIYIQTVSIDDFQKNRLKLYPNPTHATLRLTGESTLIHRYELFSANGQLVATGPIHAAQISLETYPTGLYHLRVFGRQGELSYVGKVVKE